jgi:hypothetical protein
VKDKRVFFVVFFRLEASGFRNEERERERMKEGMGMLCGRSEGSGGCICSPKKCLGHEVRKRSFFAPLEIEHFLIHHTIQKRMDIKIFKIRKTRKQGVMV